MFNQPNGPVFVLGSGFGVIQGVYVQPIGFLMCYGVSYNLLYFDIFVPLQKLEDGWMWQQSCDIQRKSWQKASENTESWTDTEIRSLQTKNTKL